MTTRTKTALPKDASGATVRTLFGLPELAAADGREWLIEDVLMVGSPAGTRGPSSAITSTTNAMSVVIGMPQPRSPGTLRRRAK